MAIIAKRVAAACITLALVGCVPRGEPTGDGLGGGGRGSPAGYTGEDATKIMEALLDSGQVSAGALVGTWLRHSLDDRSRELHAEATIAALDNPASGAQMWFNPDNAVPWSTINTTTVFGSVEVIRTVHRDGRECREYSQLVRSNHEEIVIGFACRVAGVWREARRR